MTHPSLPEVASSIPKTLSQTVYNYLKSAIITNQLPANQRTIEKDIAKIFDISTSPMRMNWGFPSHHLEQQSKNSKKKGGDV